MNERRLSACVNRWPHCEDGFYDPRCCRFPKPCSCRTYDQEGVNDAMLEPPAILAPEDRAHVEALGRAYESGLFRGAEIALGDLLEATVALGTESGDGDETGPTWNALAGHLRDVLARAQERRPE